MIPEKAHADTPVRYDLRDKGFVTPVKNQGNHKTASLFAACASMESNALLMGYGTYDFSEYHLGYFSKNDSIRIQPGVVHSIVATENTLLHEVSTPYLDDTVYIEDYYVR